MDGLTEGLPKVAAGLHNRLNCFRCSVINDLDTVKTLVNSLNVNIYDSNNVSKKHDSARVSVVR